MRFSGEDYVVASGVKFMTSNE